MRKGLTLILFLFVFAFVSVGLISALGSITKSINNTCSDSDGGLNYTVWGYVYGVNSSTGNNYMINDSCVGGGYAYLNERYCLNNSPNLNQYNCVNLGANYTCSNGACVQNGTNGSTSWCNDPDGGLNYYLKATVTNSSGASLTDQCSSLTGLTEYYCSGSSILGTSFTCPSGYTCSSGACVQNQSNSSDTTPPILTINNYFTTGSPPGNQYGSVNATSMDSESGVSSVDIIGPYPTTNLRNSYNCHNAATCNSYFGFQYVETIDNLGGIYSVKSTNGVGLSSYKNVTFNFIAQNGSTSSCGNGFCSGGVYANIYEGSTTPVLLNGFLYNVSVMYIGSNAVKFNVNGELTNTLTEGSSFRLSSGVMIYASDIVYYGKPSNLTSYARIVLGENAESCPIDCVQTQSFCSDSDGGLNYYQFGIVSTNVGNYSDSCLGPWTVGEYYCQNTSMKLANYTCNYGCIGGYCKKAPNPGCSIFKRIFKPSSCVDSEAPAGINAQVVSADSGAVKCSWLAKFFNPSACGEGVNGNTVKKNTDSIKPKASSCSWYVYDVWNCIVSVPGVGTIGAGSTSTTNDGTSSPCASSSDCNALCFAKQPPYPSIPCTVTIYDGGYGGPGHDYSGTWQRTYGIDSGHHCTYNDGKSSYNFD